MNATSFSRRTGRASPPRSRRSISTSIPSSPAQTPIRGRPMSDLSVSAPAAIEPIVSARGLRKKFGRTEVLHGLDFDIPPGRIYGLIGHNGAGKTTTLNAILGLSSYEGTVRVLGEDPFQRRARLMENVAFISDVASLPRFLRVRELFALLTNIHPNFSQE